MPCCRASADAGGLYLYILACDAFRLMSFLSLSNPLLCAVCKQFVEGHPHNARAAAAAYWLLQQVTSCVCLGTREHLAAAAEASNVCQKCVAVAWAVQVCRAGVGSLPLPVRNTACCTG